MRLVFAGTPDVALPTLRALLDSERHEVVAVVTRPDAPSGRGRHLARSPVAKLADQHGVEVLTPRKASDPEFLTRLCELAPDCCPVVAYGGLLPQAALDIPPHGWVNLHFSLLPAWRGAAPVQAAVRNGDEITGASTFRIVKELDAGPVYGVLTEPVRPGDTAGELLARLAVAGADLMVSTVDGIADGSLLAVEQLPDGVSYAAKITPADAKVDFSAPAMAVDRLIRAVTPDPGAWAAFRDERIKLGPIRIEQSDHGQLKPGELRVDRSGVLVGTASQPVRLGEVQAPGKRRIPATDWARGVRVEPGERLA